MDFRASCPRTLLAALSLSLLLHAGGVLFFFSLIEIAPTPSRAASFAVQLRTVAVTPQQNPPAESRDNAPPHRTDPSPDRPTAPSAKQGATASKPSAAAQDSSHERRGPLSNNHDRHPDSSIFLPLLQAAAQQTGSIYPHRARRDKREGTVMISIRLNKEGMLDQLEIASGSGDEQLDEAALKLFEQLFEEDFKTGIEHRSGQPVTLRIPVTFSLRKS